ncbi:replication initiator [Streptomyces hoynatensis]|uniref:Replication initiation protein n=1 Tax=Streptomyces hoynatensis TaxID=1141874 RepID=A0A3A9YJQ1_9ACTN|nr:replication initiator [Streptomyces hoynatensis]RKN36873.1 replication initiation protein [Streptomyces hoynatensis]
MTSPPAPYQRFGPAVRDLIELASLDDFDRVRSQVESVGGCACPVQLVGRSTTLDSATGEVLHTFNTADEPTGRLLVPCGNRRSSRCPSCSRVYAADTFHLIRAGLTGGKSVPDSVRSHPRVFATLTAPSFGPVHTRPTTPTGRRLPCRCGEWHGPDASTLGTPVDPATYDYAGAVLWNAHASALWARFTTYLRREVAALLGMTQKALRAVLRVSFAKVAEYQRRGLVHFHAVIRFDGPKGTMTSPPRDATADVLIRAVRNAARRVELALTSDAVGERVFRWGRQLDVREIAGFGGGAELTDKAVAAYVAKYATKGAESSGTIDQPVYCRACDGRGRIAGLDCRPCEGTGQRQLVASLPAARHARQMIRTCWELGQLPDFAGLKLWKWAHMLGFRGHFSTKSRCYSTTLGALRDVRRAWRREQAHARLGLPVPGEGSTLVVESSLSYIGSGYRSGEELLAATVRYERAVARQFAQGGVH